MKKQNLFAALAVPGLVLAWLSAAQATVPQGGELNFTVLRKGDEIGTHRLEFEQAGDELKVEIETDVAVKMLGIAVYRFEHEGHEVWRDGRLVSLNSKTNDDGTAHHLSVSRDAETLVVDGDGRQGPEDGAIIPASLWNEDLVKQSALLNTLDGSKMPVTVTTVGPETVEVDGKNLTATHYSVKGQLNRELWYDESGVLVQVKFDGADGSEISYVLR
ncbi:MAG: DUF6134 family protein [Parvibaculum sp.]|uniref:DUF6134 family protein n=1 Tax=Parvibaculum sp. TaxID=2024848 RepID=UPI0034A06D65